MSRLISQQENEGSWQGDAKQVIQVACGLLQQASAADTEGATDVALRLYQEAVVRLDTAAGLVPPTYQQVLSKHAGSARQRISVLKKEKQLGAGAVSIGGENYPQFPVNFVVMPLPPYDEKQDGPPTATILRPFWIMRKLSTSIQSAAWITPGLYASKAIWLQDGATTVIAGIPAKVKYLSALCELLEDVQLLSHHDSTKLVKGLDTFVLSAEAHFDVFVKEVTGGKEGKDHHHDPSSSVGGEKNDPVPQRSRFNRGVRELLHKGKSVMKSWKQQQDATYSSYLAWAVNILEQAQAFDRWIQYFAGTTPSSSNPHSLESSRNPAVPPPPPGPPPVVEASSSTTSSAGGVVADVNTQSAVMERLHRVAALFYSGPIRFMLADLFLLTDRYAGQSRESLSRLLPVTIALKDPTEKKRDQQKS